MFNTYMKKVEIKPMSEMKMKDIEGFLIKNVTPFGTGAKVNCPKRYIGRRVYLVITNENKAGKKIEEI